MSETEDLRDLLSLVRWRDKQVPISSRAFEAGDCFFSSSETFAKEGIIHNFEFPVRVVGFIPERQIYVLQRLLRRTFKPPDNSDS